MFTSFATVQAIQNPKKIKYDTTCLLTAIVCEDIARYYRHLTNQRLHIGLIKPSWNAHITISKVTPPEKLEIALSFDKKRIKFEYGPNVRYSGDTTGDKADTYWFLDVYSDDIREIRKSLGLPDFEKFHVTIGILQKSA